MPKKLKVASVIPVQKISGAIDGENFRPINTLLDVEKMLESVVKDQLMTFINDNNILIDNQSGFRDEHGCETALQLVINDWKGSIGEGNLTFAVFIDLKRAFETIDRQILVAKLQRYGFKENVLDWICSYLVMRTQKVKYNNCSSETLENNTGVPQGSILGPLLFILYINDIETIFTHCKIHLYADDALITLSGTNLITMNSILNAELNRLEIWLRNNKLKVNVPKTKAMLLCSKTNRNKYKLEIQNVNIVIEGEKIEFVNNFKYLGIIIDNDLNFKSHASYIIKKIACKVGLFRRISQCLPIQSKIQVYQAIIAPHVDYCSSVLFLLNKNEIEKIQKLQNKAMRSILRVNRFASVKKMCSALSWLNVKERIVLNTLTLIYKICKGKAPKYLTSIVKPSIDVHSHNTRLKKNIFIDRSKSKFTENSIYHKGIRIFNRIPVTLRECDNVKTFRRDCCKLIKEGNLTPNKQESIHYWDIL